MAKGAGGEMRTWSKGQFVVTPHRDHGVIVHADAAGNYVTTPDGEDYLGLFADDELCTSDEWAVENEKPN